MSSNFRDLPLSQPPPGIKSNFIHPVSRASQIYIAAGLCLPLIIVFVSLRFYARVAVMKKMRWDDLSLVFGLLAGIGFISMTIAAVSGGSYGIHQWDITIADFTKEQLQLSLILGAIYGPCIWFVKLSVFVLYLEVFGLLRWLRYLVFAGILVTGGFYFASMVVFLALCAPTNGHSQLSYLAALASPRCLRTRPVTTGTGVFNVISDMYLILIPLPAVWSLHLPLRKKLGLATMFLTGSIACVASICGLVYRIQGNNGTDNTWTVIPTWTTTITEITAGIIVCCMPSAVSAVKTLRTPITSLIAAYLSKKSRATSNSSATIILDKKIGSFTRLHDKRGPPKHTRSPWSGLADTTTNEWQAEDSVTQQPTASATSFPLENSRILKTTDINVEESSSLAH